MTIGSPDFIPPGMVPQRPSVIRAPRPFISATKPGKLVSMGAPSSMVTGHGPPAQRGIAGEEGGQPVGRHHPHEKTGTGAGIAEIEHIGGLDQPPDAAADHPPHALVVAPGLGPQGPHGSGAAQHVLAFEQAMDLALAHGQGAHHEGAVGDRFVARHAGVSGERAGGSGHEWLQDGDTP
jgi:hypothetical protein